MTFERSFGFLGTLCSSCKQVGFTYSVSSPQWRRCWILPQPKVLLFFHVLKLLGVLMHLGFFFFSSCCRDNSDESFLCLDYYDPPDLHTGKLAISCFRVLHSYSLSRKNGLIWICAAQNSISCPLSAHPFDFNLNISIIFPLKNVNNEHPTEEKI